MKAILLAAGRGTRISRTVNIPKSTLPIGDMTIIEHSVDLFKKNGIDVVVVTGFMRTNIEKALENYDVKFYYNPFFSVTNSAGSLWMAESELNDDVIIGNADVYWEQPVLDILLNSKKDVDILADKSRAEIGDYFFKTENEYIVGYGKELKHGERDCEYVGLCKISKNVIDIFRKHLEDLMVNERYDKWWENALYDYKEEMPIHVSDVGDLFWSEVDYYADYECILNYLKTLDPKSKLISTNVKNN